ncbi:anaphase-promoting complex, cyclosome, subunit 4-domain-containing protein [Echria macrotheca]|uniref:Anaphase-promoting complex subunit 4 n=1 Tax=Echria macrotheca TaxID=438768 RepID=A0AAJ0B509_9PEZI|nr:anaphase-promoting complex, cyclosome, subunit 4-domain-containing protein [Echria macrotheca]
MGTHRKLQQFSATKFAAPASGNHLACNPVIDLVANAGDGNTALYVWRANGQLVSKHAERSHKVEVIQWKDDGQFLAGGWSDGVVRLIGLESSKAVHHLRVCENGSGKINFIAWSRNVTGGQQAEVELSATLPSREIELDETKSLLDLPHELTFLEVETALPKISPLPVSGGSGDDMFVFSTTSSLDFVFRPTKPEDAHNVHVMIVGSTDGGIHLSIYDSLVIGSFRYSPRPPLKLASGSDEFQLCGHGSDPDISTHTLLLKQAGGDQASLHLVPMDLTFVHSSPVNLSLLASKMTTMQNLLRYLKQTQSHMTGEWKATRELPARFLNAVKEDLEKMEGGPVTIVQALYHTVVTGHVYEPLKEWLVDSLAERGHKRWEKAVVSGLENLRSLVHENFIPALERCGIILSRLLGIARFHDSRESIGFSAAQILNLLDIVSCLTVVANRILLSVMDELEHFGTFSTWLRLEIDKQASSTLSDELTEKEATMDHGKVISYIQRYLVTSPLALYFDEVTREDYAKDQNLAEDGSSLLEMLDKQFKRQESGQPYMKALPHIDFLVNYLTSRSGMVFRNIAEAKKRSVRLGRATELSVPKKIWKHDMYTCSVKTGDDSEAQAFTAISDGDDKSKVYLFQTGIAIVNGISGETKTTACGFALPKGATIVDFKFLDKSALLVLCQQQDEPAYFLFCIRYQPYHLPYGAYKTPQDIRFVGMGADSDGESVALCFVFSKLEGFVPVQMEVQKARKDRGQIPARVCLLGKDKTVCRVYALPDDWETAMSELSLDEAEEAGNKGS